MEEKLKILHPIVAAWNATLDKIPEAEQDIYCAKQPLDAMKPMIQIQILQQVMQMRLQEANGNDDDCNNNDKRPKIDKTVSIGTSGARIRKLLQ